MRQFTMELEADWFVSLKSFFFSNDLVQKNLFIVKLYWFGEHISYGLVNIYLIITSSVSQFKSF